MKNSKSVEQWQKLLYMRKRDYTIDACFNEWIIEVVKYLVQDDTNVNFCSKYIHPALVYASMFGHIEIVKYLVEKGADTSRSNVSGDTALNIASEKGYTDIVKYLIKSGDVINSKNRWSETASVQ